MFQDISLAPFHLAIYHFNNCSSSGNRNYGHVDLAMCNK